MEMNPPDRTSPAPQLLVPIVVGLIRLPLVMGDDLSSSSSSGGSGGNAGGLSSSSGSSVSGGSRFSCLWCCWW